MSYSLPPKPYTGIDELQRSQKRKDRIKELEDKYKNLSENYNGLSKRHIEALESLKRLNDTEEHNKRLRKDMSKANKRIKALTDSNKHLRERLG